jgi:outer membrane protein insertion porin family
VRPGRDRSRAGSWLLCAGLVLWPVAAPAHEVADALSPYAGRTVTAIALEGLRVTREFVARREIRTAVGQPIRVDVVAADVQRLDNLSVFAEIAVVAADDGPGVRLTFRFKEMPSWIAWAGYSYTDQDGFSGGPKISALNFAGRAISLNAKAYFGGADQYSARFLWPWISGNHLSLEVYGARLSRRDTLNGFEETSYELTPSVGTYLGDHGRMKGLFSLFEMKSDVDGKTLDPDNQDLLARFGVSFGWDTRDSWRLPRRGWQNELEVWRTAGDAHFWSMNLDLRRWLPIRKRQKVLLSGLASLQSGTVDEEVPVYLLYRMGGANSIRGYEIEDLGVRLYGKNQLIGTAEYSVTVLPLRRFDIWKFALRLGLEAAVFTDVGIAWSEPGELAMNRVKGGMGAGLRLLVPGTEMVRFDVGWSAESGIQFHFASGTKPVAQRHRLR